MNNDTLKINIIKTDIGKCFISDCHATSGYDYNYHRPQIGNLLFDGNKPTPAYAANWFSVPRYPQRVQRLVTGRTTNHRYELKDPAMQSAKLPLVILREDRDNFVADVLDALYKSASDRLPDELDDVDCEFVLICEVENFKDPPAFEYPAIKRWNYSEETYTITNQNIEHSFTDKIILPPPLLANSPCRLSSKEVYDITRQYIKTHIDNSRARITSDYDFCFEVKKIIPLIEPETLTYHNIFAKTKKARNKLHFTTKEFKESTIFQMTHTQEKYKGYTLIREFQAANEYELKEMLDTFLEDLITVINKPLLQCPHCNGTGYMEPEQEGEG